MKIDKDKIILVGIFALFILAIATSGQIESFKEYFGNENNYTINTRCLEYNLSAGNTTIETGGILKILYKNSCADPNNSSFSTNYLYQAQELNFTEVIENGTLRVIINATADADADQVSFYTRTYFFYADDIIHDRYIWKIAGVSRDIEQENFVGQHNWANDTSGDLGKYISPTIEINGTNKWFGMFNNGSTYQEGIFLIKYNRSDFSTFGGTKTIEIGTSVLVNMIKLKPDGGASTIDRVDEYYWFFPTNYTNSSVSNQSLYWNNPLVPSLSGTNNINLTITEPGVVQRGNHNYINFTTTQKVLNINHTNGSALDSKEWQQDNWTELSLPVGKYAYLMRVPPVVNVSSQMNFTIDYNNLPNPEFVSPADLSWNNSGVNLNLTCVITGTALDSAILYHNSSSGTFEENQTIDPIVAGQPVSFLINVTDGSYLWTCAGNQTTDATHRFATSNRTIRVDTLYPNMIINSITTTDGSQTATFNSTTEDENGVTNCKYTIFDSGGSVDGLNNNVSYTCNSNTAITVSNYATYNLSIEASDPAGNRNITSQTFTTTEAVAVVSGGGGGGGTTTIVYTEGNFTIEPPRIELFLGKGKTRSRDFKIINEGVDDITLEIICEDINKTGACQWVELDRYQVTIKPSESTSEKIIMTATAPLDAVGDYPFIFEITDEVNRQKAKLDVLIQIRARNIIFQLLDNLSENYIILGKPVPKWLFIFGIPILTSILVLFFYPEKSWFKTWLLFFSTIPLFIITLIFA